MPENKEVDPENIAAIIIDKEKKEQLIFTKDQLINQLQQVCSVIALSFDTVYKDEFKRLSEELSFTLVKQFVGYKTATAEKDELRITCGNLLRNAANTIIASISLLRNGFRLQSEILIRSEIEMCATVVHLLVDKKALADFKNDKLNSTYSISVANKQIPLFGKAWGLLSNHQIHINSIHADWYPMNQYADKTEIPASVVL
jgi:hypothetical protein